MSEPEQVYGKLIKDDGIEHGASRLTNKKIRDLIQKFLKTQTGARLKTYINTCVHCGLCSEACHYYLSHDNDPKFSPAAKVKQTMGEILKKQGNVDIEFMKMASEISYTECNLCKRCSMYCPFGVDVSYIMLLVRRICHSLGLTPKYIQDTAHSHAATSNQMWIKEDEWLDTLQWQEEEAQEEISTLRIPLDVEGADVMYSVIGPEPKFRAQLIYQAAVIMEKAGINWTMSSTPGWDNSDMAMYTGDHEIMGRTKRVHFDKALELKVKRIVMGECGHAFRSVYDMGNRWLGYKMTPVPIVHAIEFYYELFRDKKIKIPKKYQKPVTLHDPCNIIRGRGLHEMARYVVNETCETFIEMHPNREHNYCCCAGGGVINCGPPYKMKRVKSNKVKAEQLFAAKSKGAEILISPCHNCHDGLEDINHHYGLHMELKFLGDIIYEVMEK